MCPLGISQYCKHDNAWWPQELLMIMVHRVILSIETIANVTCCNEPIVKLTV